MEETLLEQMTRVRPEVLDENALKLFIKIMEVIDERDDLKQRLAVVNEMNVANYNKYCEALKENERLKQMVNFGGITITNCPNCKKEITVNFCRETENWRKKYEGAVADYEYEKSKNQRAIEILEKEPYLNKTEDALEILKGDK